MFGGLGGHAGRFARMAPWGGLVVLWLAVSVSVGLPGSTPTHDRSRSVRTPRSPRPPTGTSRSISDRCCRDCGWTPTCRSGSASWWTCRRPTPRDLNDLLARDALIASQPDGEIRRLHDVVVDMAVDNAIAGAGTGLFVAVLAMPGWRTIGKVRRAELARLIHLRALVRSRSGHLRSWSRWRSRSPPSWYRPATGQRRGPTHWHAARAAAGAAWIRGWTRQRLAAGPSTTGGIGLIRPRWTRTTGPSSCTATCAPRYRGSRASSGKPGPDQKAALLLSDRHDNIGMDPVAAALAETPTPTGDRRGRRHVVRAVAGRRSASTLPAESTSGTILVVAYAGNHDAGGHTRTPCGGAASPCWTASRWRWRASGLRRQRPDQYRPTAGADTPGAMTVQEQSARSARCTRASMDDIMNGSSTRGGARSYPSVLPQPWPIAKRIVKWKYSHCTANVGPVSRFMDGHFSYYCTSNGYTAC